MAHEEHLVLRRHLQVRRHKRWRKVGVGVSRRQHRGRESPGESRDARDQQETTRGLIRLCMAVLHTIPLGQITCFSNRRSNIDLANPAGGPLSLNLEAAAISVCILHSDNSIKTAPYRNSALGLYVAIHLAP